MSDIYFTYLSIHLKKSMFLKVFVNSVSNELKFILFDSFVLSFLNEAFCFVLIESNGS